jgi:hypothetical protein
VPWVETASDVDGMTVEAIKMQLEKYRSHVGDIPKKSEINKMKKDSLVTFFKTVIAQYKASQSNVLDEAHAEHSASQPSINISHSITEGNQSLYIEDPTVIDKLLVPQLKAQLELYRSQSNSVPSKSVINKMKKTGLVDLLKEVVAQFKASEAGNFARNVQNSTQAEGSGMAEEAPARIEDLSKIRSTKTSKTVLKIQLELYRNLVAGIPSSDQLEGMKKPELVEQLVKAVNYFKAHRLKSM